MRWLVGTYGDSIAVLDLDTVAGRLTAVAACPCPANPSFLALHPRLPVVYAVHELGSWNDGFGGAAGAYAIGADVEVLGVGVGAHVGEHGVGAGAHVGHIGAGAGVDKHGVSAGGHAGHVVATGASVGDRGVHTGAHVGPVGAGGGLDSHGVGAGAHVGDASAGAGVGDH